MASKSRIHIYPDKVVRTVVGNPVKIECIQTGPKLSFVSWSKVSEQSSRTLVNGSGFADLFFESIKLSDAGKYRCLAKDGVEETVIVSVGGKKVASLILLLVSRTLLSRAATFVKSEYISDEVIVVEATFVL